MKRYQVAVGILAGVVLVVLAAYAIFAVFLVGFDVASYSSDGVTVSGLEYETVLENAAAAGYTVERVGSSGYHPDGIAELDAELGHEYEVFRVVAPYSEDRRMWITFDGDDGGTVTLFADDARGAFTTDHLPPDEWLIEHFTLLFDVDEATAQGYLEELKDEIRTGDPSAPGASTPSVQVREPVEFQAYYEDLTSRATAVNSSSMPGSGWHERRYFDDGQLICQIDVVLPRATVTHKEAGYTYQVHVDYHGGVSVDAQTRAYRSFDEDDVRSEFRVMFDAMGIPPDTIDHLQLEHRGSVW